VSLDRTPDPVTPLAKQGSAKGSNSRPAFTKETAESNGRDLWSSVTLHRVDRFASHPFLTDACLTRSTRRRTGKHDENGSLALAPTRHICWMHRGRKTSRYIAAELVPKVKRRIHWYVGAKEMKDPPERILVFPCEGSP